MEFKLRVSGAIRAMGNPIEAHEAYQNELYDQSDDVMTGLIGVMAGAYHGRSYGSDGVHQVGDDIAMGIITKAPPKDESAGLVGLMAIMLGMR